MEEIHVLYNVENTRGKGLVINDHSVIHSQVPREMVQSQMAHSFVDEVFSGSLQSFFNRIISK